VNCDNLTANCNQPSVHQFYCFTELLNYCFNVYPLYLAKNRGEVYQQGEFLVKYAGKRDSWHMYKMCKPQAA
jgi:hypothetical protein